MLSLDSGIDLFRHMANRQPLFCLAAKVKRQSTRALSLLLTLIVLVLVHVQSVTGAEPSPFLIGLNQTVSLDQPGPGAGRISQNGERDVYVFQGTPGQSVFLGMLDHDANLGFMTWEVLDPAGNSISLQCFACQDHGLLTLPRTGEYRIVVGREDLNVTGNYAFRLYAVPDPEIFQIELGEEIRADGTLEGAGMIESPGATDEYQFQVSSGQKIIFRLIEFERSIEQLNWSLKSPTLGTLYSGDLSRYEPRIIELTESGIFSLIIGDSSSAASGHFRFRIEGIPPADEMSIDVSQAVVITEDMQGGGQLQAEGSADIYHWHMEEPGWIFLDLVDAERDLQFAEWKLLGPGKRQIFSTYFFSGDPGLIHLDQAGDYQMIVGGNISSGTGTYAMHLQPVPENEEFSIVMGQLVSFNQPGDGAGHIGVPGAQDVYQFRADAGQRIFVESLQAERGLGFLSWRMEDEEGDVVFEECLRCKDPGLFTLSRSGIYRMIVGGAQHAGIGQYAFRIWEIPEPEIFEKGDQVFSVSPNPNEDGAGTLLVPGEVDTFIIEAVKEETWHFKPTHGSGSPTLMWRLFDPRGNILFDAPLRAAPAFAQFLAVRQPGPYKLECYHASSSSAAYGFEFEKLDHCERGEQEGSAPLPALTIVNPTSGQRFTESHIDMVGSIGETPGLRGIDLVLALDSSESLRTNDPADLRLDAVRTFVRAMPKGLNIRIALVDFDQTARLIQPLTSDFDLVNAQLDLLDQSGGTNIEQALQVSLDEILSQENEEVARSIILFSDGENSVGSAANAVFRASRADVRVHTVYLGANPSEGSDLLRTIAEATCANYRHAKSAAELVQIFKNIASPVPIQRMEAFTSADPDQVYPVDFVGQFWGAPRLPITQGENGGTVLTVRLITDEQPERTVEQSVVVQFESLINLAPVITPFPDIGILEDRSRTYALRATDQDHDSSQLTWSFQVDRPDLFPEESGWALLTRNGRPRLSLSPVPNGSGQASGTLRVTDPAGAFSESTFGITVHEINDPPYFAPIGDVVLDPGESIRVLPLQEIHDGSIFEQQPLVFSAVAGDDSILHPPVVIYENASSTGELHLQPVTQAEGTTMVEVTLSDGESVNGTLVRRFQVTVLPNPNVPPTIQWNSPSAASKLFIGDALLLSVEASDPDGSIDSVRFFANGTELPKPSLKSPSLNWEPESAGFYELSATVEDENQAIAQTRSILVEVIERPPDFSLKILTPEASAVVCFGQLVDVEVELAGGDPDGNVVHLFAGDELQGVRNAPPYHFQWEADEMGDFLLTAVAFREDGSRVVSEPIRAGVSETCLQVGLLVENPSLQEIDLAQEYLFEMGVGSQVVSLSEVTDNSLARFDLAIAFIDASVGVQPSVVRALDHMLSNLEKPVFVLGHRVASQTSALTSAEKTDWEHLIHLQPFGSHLVTEPLEFQETGFFRSILDGRFGSVEPFVLSYETDRAIADDTSEVIGFSGETDLVVRSPAGNEPDFGQPRSVTFNFTLTGNGDEHSELQRKRLFQNAVCWAMRCGGCSNAVLPVLPILWQSEAETGEQLRQAFRFVNNGACELTGGRVELTIPDGLLLEDIIMSQGLGWRQDDASNKVVLNLGRLTSGAQGGIQAELLMRAVSPGDYLISICSYSNNTDLICAQQSLKVAGQTLTPPVILIRRGLNGALSLVVQGSAGIRYRVEFSADFTRWSHLGNAQGVETVFPVPTNEQGLPITLFYRARIQP